MTDKPEVTQADAAAARAGEQNGKQIVEAIRQHEARAEIKALWKQYGGEQHGPMVEHYSIEEQAFYRFASALLARHRTSQSEREGVLEEAARVAGETAAGAIEAKLSPSLGAQIVVQEIRKLKTLKTTPAPVSAELEEALERLRESADNVPKETPAPGGCSTVHQFSIAAGVIWELDKRAQEASAILARYRGEGK